MESGIKSAESPQSIRGVAANQANDGAGLTMLGSQLQDHILPGQAQDKGPALLVDVVDVAQMLSASERTVWRLADAGKMPAPIRIGRLVRWSRQAILDWIEAGCPAVRTAASGTTTKRVR